MWTLGFGYHENQGKAPHPIPPQIAQESYRRNHMKQSVFTQPDHELARRSFARFIARENLARGGILNDRVSLDTP
jgi:hypothetical protein